MVSAIKGVQPPPELLTTREACEFLRVGQSTLYELAARGRIKRSYVGKRAVRWRRSELHAYLESVTREKPPRGRK